MHYHLRGACKQRRKRYGRYDSRGRLAGKRPITTRPLAAETRAEIGHWEADTVLGAGQAGACVLSMVERKTGYLLLGPLRQRTSAAVNARVQQLIAAQPHPVQTITVDNGTEFHDYARLERATATRFYFATPHHAWERGTNENTNSLIRQYLPKRQSMAHPPNTIAIGSRRNSTAGRGSGWAFGLRRNAMRDETPCCTSKLISDCTASFLCSFALAENRIRRHCTNADGIEIKVPRKARSVVSL